VTGLVEMIYMMLYEEESKGLDGPRRHLQDGPRAVTWQVAELEETAQVPPLPTSINTTIRVLAIAEPTLITYSKCYLI
jgi:hypothetical protein